MQQRGDDFQTRLTRFKRELERTQAFQEIEKIMGLYSYWHTAGMHVECLGLFALDTPGVRAEMVSGVYRGRAGVERLYREFHPWVESINAKGRMHVHPLTTPVIEVAEDLRTAKGVWNSPGHDTFASAAGQPLKAYWVWVKYGCDFILENGRWKIWHLHVYPLFFTPFQKSWVEPQEQSTFTLPERFKPDQPPTTDTFWRADRIYPNIPAPPLPYKTFDERTAY